MQVIHITSYNLPRWPKSHSGEVLILMTIRIIIKFSSVFAVIDQLILQLSIPQMRNLERNISHLQSKKVFIKMI